jgi:hypothetical protein
MTHAGSAGLTSREPGKTFEEMLVAIGDSLRDVASSNDGEDGEDVDDEKTEQRKVSEDDEPGWVMGTIIKTGQQRMERLWQKRMKLDELAKLAWENAANYFCKRYKKYCTFKLSLLAIFQPQTIEDAPAPPPTMFGELLESVQIVPGRVQMPQGTLRRGSSHIRLGSVKPQSKSSIPCGEPAAEPDSSMLLKAKLVEPVSFYLGI